MNYTKIHNFNDASANEKTVAKSKRKTRKARVFKAFRAFPSRLHGRLKKETVNLSLKNAILCLRFGLVYFILTNHVCAESLFFDYRDALFEG